MTSIPDTRDPRAYVNLHLMRYGGQDLTPPAVYDHTEAAGGFVALVFGGVTLLVDGHGVDVLRAALDKAGRLLTAAEVAP